MTTEEYFKANPDAAVPTYRGARADQGRIVVDPQYPSEGYAVLKCGNTEVQIGYTLLANLSVQIDADSYFFKPLGDLQRALNSITCEASLGRKGD